MWNKIGVILAIVLVMSKSIFAEDKLVEKKVEPEKKEEASKKTDTEKSVDSEKPKEEVLKVNKVDIATLDRFKPLAPRSEVKPANAEVKPETEKIVAEQARKDKVNAVLNLFVQEPKEAKTWIANETKPQNKPEVVDALGKLKTFLETKRVEKKEIASADKNSEKTKESAPEKKLSKDDIQKLIEIIVQ